MDPSQSPQSRSQEEHFRRLVDVGTGLLSELDLESVLLSVVEAARELTSARYAALGVLDRERAELERFIYLGIDDEVRREIGNLPRGRGVLGELIREPRPLRLTDVYQHPHAYGFPPGHPPMHTFLGVPITIKGEAFGNLYMTEKEGGVEFDEEDEAAAITLANWAAIAIENANLYTSLSEREAELEHALRRSETSLDIARAVGGETDVDRVLDLIVKRARALVEARTLLVVLRREGRLVVVAQAGIAGPEPGELTIPIEDKVFEAAMKGKMPQRIDAQSPPSAARLRERFGAESALVVPLLFRGYSVGTLVALDRETGTEFDEEDLRLMQAFASSAATAVVTAQSVEAERLRLRVEIGERERRRWAQELHDDALQGLAAIRIRLASELQREGEDRAERIERAATEAVEQLEGQITELSRLIDDLRPASLERLGLPGGLEALAEEYSVRGDLRVETEIESEIAGKLSAEEERVVYRLLQEALNNVLKHASATVVRVIARLADDEVQVLVKDEGRGFDQGSVGEGRGLLGMRERVEMLRGEIEIRSEAGDGTEVEVRVPVRAG